MFIGQLLLTLYDFYFASLGFPIVPVFGAVLFVTATLMLPRPQRAESARKRHRTILLGLLLGFLFFVSALWGLAAFKSATIKGPAGISFGILLYCVTMLQEDNVEYKEYLFRFLNVILALHLFAWILQFLSFTFFHNFLDYLKPVTGIPSRHGAPMEELVTKISRYTGLFAEPAAYVTFIFMGITARMIRNDLKLKLFDGLLIASMALSLAITGYFLILICLVFWASTVLRTPRAWSILAVLLGVLIVYGSTQMDSPYLKIIVLRLATPSSDASVKVRTTNAFESYNDLPESGQIFGAGFGNYALTENVSNGLLNLFIFLGVLGAPIISGLFIWLLRLRRFPWMVWLFLFATLPFAPPFTLQNWWLWIALMVLFGQDRIRAREAYTVESALPHPGSNPITPGAITPQH